MRFTAVMGLVVIIGLAVMQPEVLVAQNDEAGEAVTEKEYRGRLPIYFGKLGLSDPQKEKLYAIQDSYVEKIAALEKQIQALEDERDKSMETLLTPGQKLRLQELREEARLKEQARLDGEQAAQAADSSENVEESQ